MDSANSTLQRLDNQIAWYSRKSQESQRWYKAIKVIQIVAAAIIPLMTTLNTPAYLVGSLGVLIVVLEGVQSLNQFHHHWISYRATGESLKHEKFLYLAKAGPYAKANDANALLAERVESLISQEHAKWVSTEQQTEKQNKAA